MQNEVDPDRSQQEQQSLKQSLKQSSWKGFTYVNESIGGTPHPESGELASAEEYQSALANKLPDQNFHALAATRIGDRICIASLNCGETNNRLMGMGLIPGAVLEVISRTATGSVIVALQDAFGSSSSLQRLGLGAEMARRIQVIDAEQAVGANLSSFTRMTTMQTTPEVSTVKLRDVAIGTTLRVVGYESAARDYKRKLLAMGLTPGTELRVTRHAPLGDPTEIAVRGFQLSLRKAEADALIVAPISGS
jgi:ferrous iron transport protein A